MAVKKKMTEDEKNLTRRYLLWCYKTTKEDIDRIDRYYTQLQVDVFFLKELQSEVKPRSERANKEYSELIKGFEVYMDAKKSSVDKKKYKNDDGKTLNEDYMYLQSRLKAIKKAAVHFLGKTELNRITEMYEEEMTCRILEAEGTAVRLTDY